MAVLFPEAADLPDGFAYYEEIISPAEETALVDDPVSYTHLTLPTIYSV